MTIEQIHKELAKYGITVTTPLQGVSIKRNLFSDTTEVVLTVKDEQKHELKAMNKGGA